MASHTSDNNLRDSFERLAKVDAKYNALVGTGGVPTNVLNARAALFDAVKDNQDNQAVLMSIDIRISDFEDELDKQILYAKVAEAFDNNRPYHEEGAYQTLQHLIKFGSDHPDVETLFDQYLHPKMVKDAAEKQKTLAKLLTEVDAIRSKSTSMESNQQSAAREQDQVRITETLLTDLRVTHEDLRTVRAELAISNCTADQLFAVFGKLADTDNFRCNVQYLTDNIKATWPFTKEDIRLACAEWIRSNDFVPECQVGQFPEKNAFHFWLTSITKPHLLNHQVLADWVISARDHFQRVDFLGFLATALWYLAAEDRFSKSQTWVAVRLLEFFIILDKENMLTTQLRDFLSKIFNNADSEHPVPIALCLWIAGQLDKEPLTRGECLASLVENQTAALDLGDGIKAFQVAGAPPCVLITDPADKIFKYDLDDIMIEYTEEYDLVVKFNGYEKYAVVYIEDIRRIGEAFPDLDLRRRGPSSGRVKILPIRRR